MYDTYVHMYDMILLFYGVHVSREEIPEKPTRAFHGWARGRGAQDLGNVSEHKAWPGFDSITFSIIHEMTFYAEMSVVIIVIIITVVFIYLFFADVRSNRSLSFLRSPKHT